MCPIAPTLPEPLAAGVTHAGPGLPSAVFTGWVLCWQYHARATPHPPAWVFGSELVAKAGVAGFGTITTPAAAADLHGAPVAAEAARAGAVHHVETVDRELLVHPAPQKRVLGPNQRWWQSTRPRRTGRDAAHSTMCE